MRTGAHTYQARAGVVVVGADDHVMAVLLAVRLAVLLAHQAVLAALCVGVKVGGGGMRTRLLLTQALLT